MLGADRAIRFLLALALAVATVLPATAAGIPLAGKADIRAQLAGSGNFALLIGISQFDKSSGWQPLDGVDTEIAAVSAVLETQHDFKVVQPFLGGRRMTKVELTESIKQFVKDHGRPGNRLVVYIASHGYRDLADPDAKGYVVVSDSLAPGASGFAAHAYSVDELQRDLADIEARHLFLFVNTCFSGSLMPITQTRGTDDDGPGGAEPVALSREVAGWVRRNLEREARVILTAGDGAQKVPDDSEYRRAVVDGLAGAADGNRDGLILGTELAAYVKGRVGPHGVAIGIPNDPVFASLSRGEERGVPPGEFVFLSPKDPSPAAVAGVDLSDEVLAARRSRLKTGQFTECADCPVMVELPPVTGTAGESGRIALARTETTFDEWDACYRDLGCSRYIQDDGRGRGDRPVGGLTWRDAQEFGVWLKCKEDIKCRRYDIPTREQWLAGIGVTPTAAALTDDAEGLLALARAGSSGAAVCSGCGGPDTGAAARVASLEPTGNGLYDMQGNLWEWLRPAETEDACPIGTERCAKDGQVIGGSFATSAAALTDATLHGAVMPRTGNRMPYSLPTVGLRMACTMR